MLSQNRFILILLFGASSLSSLASAREYQQFYKGARCQAMGGACVAVVNDETALAVNPAALGRLRDSYGTFFDPEIESGSKYDAYYSLTNIGAPFELRNILGALNTNRESMYHLKIQTMPSFVAKNFGIGILSSVQTTATISADGTEVDLYHRNDLAFLLGYNLKLFDGRVKIGVNAKVIDRVEVDQEHLSTIGPDSYPEIGTGGVGLSTDVALMLQAPWQYIPTLSAVVRDVGGTSYNLANSTRSTASARPATQKQDVDVGAALFPIYTNDVRGSFTVEYKGVLTMADEADKSKRFHAGTEINFGDVFYLRGGWNQRYYTYGIEFQSERMQVQFASYGEEVGTATDTKEDRRYILKAAYRF